MLRHCVFDCENAHAHATLAAQPTTKGNMATFYSIDGSRPTFQEFWWGSKNPLTLLIAAVVKTLRIKIPCSSDDANVDSPRSFVTETLPPELEQKFGLLAAQIEAMGFCDPVYHFIEDHNTQSRIAWATFRHVSGQHCARIHYRYWGKVQKTERALFPMFITAFPNGTFLVSSSGKPDVAAPASVRMNRMQNAPLDSLWSRHEQLATELSAPEGCLMVTIRDEVIEITERLHETQRDFHLARKFFRPLTQKQSKEAEDTAMRVEQARALGQQYPEVMVELGKLQDAKASWASVLWLLAISMAVFIGAGGKQWSWKVTFAVVPILLFHEAGHWLAMRLFGYRNLRMFFIPMFGAAVTGRHWNVAGWKKALVSLAGPLPGIMVGVGLTAVALITGNANVRFAALMLLILNAINLAPLLPLDGGHFLQSTLFCRNRWLDLIFKLVAILGLIAASLTGVAPFMKFVAIGIAVGLPLQFKLSKATDQFRSAPIPPMLPGEDRISASTAAPLIEAVKAALPKSATNKTVAQWVINLFENINARPPGVVATIGLLIVYAGSLVVSTVCITLLVVAGTGSVRQFIARAAMQPKHSLAANGYSVIKGERTPTHLNPPRELVVANFKKTAEATQLFEATTTSLPPNTALLQFGDSVVLSLPAHDSSRSKWFDQFQTATTNTYAVVSNNTVTVSLMFLAPDTTAASNLEVELNDYSTCSASMNIAPPWDESATAAESSHRERMRHLWCEFDQRVTRVWDNPALMALGKQISSASRRGDMDKVAELEKAQDAQMKELQAAAREKLKAEYPQGETAELLALNLELANTSPTNRVARKALHAKVAEHLGVASQTTAPRMTTFLIQRTGLIIQIPYATISDPQYTLPAMMRWLSAQKCASFKYDLVEGYGMDD
ncbi:MAG: hypothetical protein JWO95_2237 [Verrucomicrobiales bacterium]|nr:hypothetical protein [Verrucomicrobiales bacterium]